MTKAKRTFRHHPPPWKTFRIARLKLAPGDMLVLRTEMLLTSGQVTEIRERLKEQLPPDLNARIIILTAGLQLAVLSKAEIEARAA